MLAFVFSGFVYLTSYLNVAWQWGIVPEQSGIMLYALLVPLTNHVLCIAPSQVNFSAGCDGVTAVAGELESLAHDAKNKKLKISIDLFI